MLSASLSAGITTLTRGRSASETRPILPSFRAACLSWRAKVHPRVPLEQDGQASDGTIGHAQLLEHYVTASEALRRPVRTMTWNEVRFGPRGKRALPWPGSDAAATTYVAVAITQAAAA